MSSQKYYVGSQAASIKTVPKLRPYDGVKIITGKTEEDSETGDSYAIVYKSDGYPRDDSNAHILVISNPLGSTEQANRIFDRIQHYEHQPFTASDAHLDIHAQLGDAVTLKGVYGSIISQDIDFTSGIKVSDISSPNGDETDNEFGVRAGTSSERALERAFETIVTQFGIEEGHIWSFIADPQNGLSSKIDQTADHITLMVHEETTRATDEEAAIREYYDSQIQMTANSITAEVNHRIEEDEALQSQIQMTDNNITAEVNHRIEDIATLRSQIQMTADSIMASVMGDYVNWHAEDSAHHQINFQLYGYGHPDTSEYYAYNYQNQYYIDRSNGYYYRSEITDTAVNWITGRYIIDIYGYGPPDPGQYNPQACRGQHYLDQSTGKLYLADLRVDGYNWKVETTLEKQTTNTWGWVFKGQATPDADSLSDKMSAEIQITQNSIISTVAGSMKNWDTTGYTISIYGYGPPDSNQYKPEDHLNEYYLDQTNGLIYRAARRASGVSWVAEAYLEDLVTSEVSSSITQFADNISLEVTSPNDGTAATFSISVKNGQSQTVTKSDKVEIWADATRIHGDLIADAIKSGKLMICSKNSTTGELSIDDKRYVLLRNNDLESATYADNAKRGLLYYDEYQSSGLSNEPHITWGLFETKDQNINTNVVTLAASNRAIRISAENGVYIMALRLDGNSLMVDPNNNAIVYDTLPPSSGASNGRIIFVKES